MTGGKKLLQIMVDLWTDIATMLSKPPTEHSTTLLLLPKFAPDDWDRFQLASHVVVKTLTCLGSLLARSAVLCPGLSSLLSHPGVDELASVVFFHPFYERDAVEPVHEPMSVPLLSLSQSSPSCSLQLFFCCGLIMLDKEAALSLSLLLTPYPITPSSSSSSSSSSSLLLRPSLAPLAPRSSSALTSGSRKSVSINDFHVLVAATGTFRLGRCCARCCWSSTTWTRSSTWTAPSTRTTTAGGPLSR
eukprot:578762-Rhodomonas_salina.1